MTDKGFLLINKPKDWTSHDVIAYLRKVTGIKKIGHAGTLDPFATGLLIVGVGREYTKRLDEFKALPKTYIATLKLGAISDTYDSTGKITANNQKHTKTIEEWDNRTMGQFLKKFIGKQKQIPPMYSAKKVGGKKLYELARKGIEIERKANEIKVYSLELLKFENQILIIKCQVSCGTYIRTLASDIGQALEYGAYCDELERIKIGKYHLDDATNLQQIKLSTDLHYITTQSIKIDKIL